MGETTGIAWTDHTFNAWVGCQHAGPGCDHCYAETLVTQRMSRDFAERRRTTPGYWQQPRKWDRVAAAFGRKRVFCCSLADVFDNQAPDAWRADLWALVRETPNLDWQIVTKRIGNAAKMLPPDWGDGYPNVWLIATVVTQAEAERDIPKLLRTKARVRGLSIEPQLEAIDLRFTYDDDEGAYLPYPWFPGMKEPTGKLHWVITGGESGKVGVAREYRVAWARALIAQCRAAGVACFVKQLGSNCPDGPVLRGKGDHPDEWPADLRVREFPR